MFLCVLLCAEKNSLMNGRKAHTAVVIFLRALLCPPADGKKNKIEGLIRTSQIVIKEFTRENIGKL